MALNCNKEIPGVTDYMGSMGVPAGKCYHCHTGRCPVGITTQDPELRKRLVVDEAAERVYNFLHTLTLEVQLLARACGKTNVHWLEPEDLAALTVEAAAMARVPLAGTEYIARRDRGEDAQRDQAPARAPPREPRRRAARRRRALGGRATEEATAMDEPEKTPGHRRRVPLRPAVPLPGGHRAWSRTSTSSRPRPGEDINWLEDIAAAARRRASRRCSTATRTRSCKIYFPIPDGREDEIARKVLIKHLQEGNSYGIQLKEKHTKFPQPELGPWVQGSKTVGTDWKPPVLEGWEPPLH